MKVKTTKNVAGSYDVTATGEKNVVTGTVSVKDNGQWEAWVTGVNGGAEVQSVGEWSTKREAVEMVSAGVDDWNFRADFGWCSN